ncbi:MAG: hypothetical protein Q8Q54_17490 [Methylococcales bacterium]|nr:hypothetical protein [Methylococcales bacterium]MDP3840712.1 hypothetical protein [Methylococcales bacterium]
MIIYIAMTYSIDFRQKVLSVKEQENLTGGGNGSAFWHWRSQYNALE